MPFANTNRVLEDKQQTTLPGCPQEVWQHGFTPPVRLPDGRVQKGDVLPASWLNNILFKLYQAAASTPTASATPNAIPTANWEPTAGTTGVGPWFGIHCGPLTLEVGVYGTASNDPGTLTVQTPIKAGTLPQLYLLDLSSPVAGAGGKMALCTQVNSGQNFTIYSRPLTRSGAAGAGLFLYICILERSDAWTPISSFCENPRTFADGQTSFTAPTQDQQLYGFAPARMESGNIVPGDTLPANVLNYMLHDLSASFGVVGWEIRPRSGGVSDYRIIIGDMQIVSSQYTVAAAPAAGLQMAFAFPFGASDPSTQIFTFGTPVYTPVTTAAVTGAASNTMFNVAVRDVSGSNPATGIASGMFGLAIGPAPAGVSRKWRKVPGLLNGFANQPKTYADGQVNKVSPVADRISVGFVPNRKVAGAPVPGDMVTANELNYLFNDLYASAAKIGLDSGVIAADPANKITGGGYIKLGFLLIEWQTMAYAAADYDSRTIRRQAYAKPFQVNKSPYVFLTDTSVSDGASFIFATNAATDGLLTNSTVDFTGVKLSNGALNVVNGVRLLAIGAAS